jgi:hypothetical protein
MCTLKGTHLKSPNIKFGQDYVNHHFIKKIKIKNKTPKSETLRSVLEKPCSAI